MKTAVQEGVENVRQENTFPALYRNDAGLVIVVLGMNTDGDRARGYVVHPTVGNPVGFFSSTWDISAFERLPRGVVVTLENE